MARREDDKCASYGSLFIGQSSGTQVETEHGRRKPVGAGEAGEIRCEIRFAPKQVWTLWGRAEKPGRWKGGYWGGQFTPRGTTYVFVNVVVAPRYVARLRLGSGGLKVRRKTSAAARLAKQDGRDARQMNGGSYVHIQAHFRC